MMIDDLYWCLLNTQHHYSSLRMLLRSWQFILIIMIHQVTFMGGKALWQHRTDHQSHALSLDQFRHQPLNKEIGPVCLGSLTLFAASFLHRLKNQQDNLTVVYTLLQNNNVENSILMVVSFEVLFLNKSVKESLQPFNQLWGQLRHFGDITNNPDRGTFCSIQDCLQSLHTVSGLRLPTPSSKQYFYQARLENGGISQILHQRVYSFSDPSLNQRISLKQMAAILKDLQVEVVVQFNETQYSHDEFMEQGIHIVSLPFPDGGVPSEDVLERFIQVSKEYKVLGLHCKAGLGRTGTMGCVLLMRELGMRGKQAIGWVRMCRPGSVSGIQGKFLENYEKSR